MQIKATPTTYKGTEFRSQLEARWARFFDSLSIIWEYEPRLFKLTKALWYVPDFRLPQVGMWAEVKPVWPNEQERLKAQLLAAKDGRPCLILNGLPSRQNYWAVHPDGSHVDYVPSEGRHHLREGRFYSMTGLKYPMQAPQAIGDETAEKLANQRAAVWSKPTVRKSAVERLNELADRMESCNY